MHDKCPVIKSEKLDLSDDENDPKNLDEIETIAYASRRESDSSTTSTETNNSDTTSEASSENISIDVDDLSKSLKTTLKVEDDSDEENLSSLETKLKNASEDDFEDRAPMGGRRAHREYVHPYQVNRSVNHQSGGSLVQPIDPTNQATLNDTEPNFLNNLPNFPILTDNVSPDNSYLQDLGEDIGDILNNYGSILDAVLEPIENSLNLHSDDATFPDIPTISNQVPNQIFSSPSVSNSFTARQSSPAHSFSSGYQSSALSPQSYFSADTEPVGSPDLPTTLPGSSGSTSSDEDEDRNEEATTAVRTLIDTQHFTEKKYEWVRASSQEVEELVSGLNYLLSENTRYSTRNLVRIYAIIHSLQKRDKNSLIKLFTDNPDIIFTVASKNEPLLLRYIVETIQNLGLNLQTFGESPIYILLKLLERDQDMKDILKVLLGLRSWNNEVIFSLSERDHQGLTFLHHVFLKMQNFERKQLYNNYIQICLSFDPDLTLLDLRNKQTYLHYAVKYSGDCYIIEQILRKASVFNGIIDIVNASDVHGITALRMASNLPSGRKEVEDVIRRYIPLDDDWLLNIL